MRIAGNQDTLKKAEALRTKSTLSVVIPAWQASTAYLENDIIIENAKLYKRNTDGTSGLTFDVTEEAEWTKLSSDATSIATWTSATAYALGQMALNPFTGGLIQSNTARTSGAAFDTTEAGEWTFVAGKASPCAIGNIYTPGEIATSSDDANIYIAPAALEANSTSTRDDGSSWKLYAQTETTLWTGGVYYFLGEKVKQGSRLLEAPTAFFSEATFDAIEAIKWNVLNPISLNDWQATTYYYANEQVIESGKIYQRIAGGVSRATFDATEIALWTLKITGGTGIADWAGATAYTAGQLAFSPQGDIISRNAAGTSLATFNLDYGFWQLVSTSAKPTVWAASTVYYAGHTVTYTAGGLGINRTIKRLTTGISLATFDTTGEGDTWMLVNSNDVIPQWAANTYYFASEKVLYLGLLMTRVASAKSEATFNATETVNWLPVHQYKGYLTPRTISTSWVLSNDCRGLIVNNVVAPMTIDCGTGLQEDTPIKIVYTQNTGTITLVGANGCQIISPVTFLPVASYVLPGAVGQYGSLELFRMGNYYYIN